MAERLVTSLERGLAQDAGTLSPREHQVLQLLAVGLDLGAVSRTMGIERVTANRHLQNVYVKLGARSRTHAVVLGLQRGLVTLA